MKSEKSIGIDIGTTTICAVVVDCKTGAILEQMTKENDSTIKTQNTWEKIQDPTKILGHAINLIDYLTEKYEGIITIGLTGQMHGILYYNGEGAAVSPLYNWQDGRGDLNYRDGKTYSEFITSVTGYRVATGFGAVTHFYLTKCNLLHKEAIGFCTIQDYIVMRLTGTKKPRIHTSNGASIGLYDLESNRFDDEMIQQAGMDYSHFPEIAKEQEVIGHCKGMGVCVAIGDNQSSFLGSVRCDLPGISINIGTSSQISIFTPQFKQNTLIEMRPAAGGGYLCVGSPLCGGRAYALLEGFFKEVVQMATGAEVPPLYGVMEQYAHQYLEADHKLEIRTQFSGTRQDPFLRGTVHHLGFENFTPGHFIVGVLEGIVLELYEIYLKMIPNLSVPPQKIICSGNAVRLNKSLQRIISSVFNMPISIPVHPEEAAYGAALFALVAIRYYDSIERVQELIQYQT